MQLQAVATHFVQRLEGKSLQNPGVHSGGHVDSH